MLFDIDEFLEAITLDNKTKVTQIISEAKEFNINAKNSDGYNALLLATQHNRASMVELLLKNRNIDVNTLTPNGKEYELDCKILKVILTLESTKNIFLRQGIYNGSSALIIALKIGNNKIAKQILAHPSCNQNLTDIYSNSPLIVAILTNNQTMISELLAKDTTNVDLQTINGTTPLMWAATLEQNETIRNLTAKNANQDIEDLRGKNINSYLTFKDRKFLAQELMGTTKVTNSTAAAPANDFAAKTTQQQPIDSKIHTKKESEQQKQETSIKSQCITS